MRPRKSCLLPAELPATLYVWPTVGEFPLLEHTAALAAKAAISAIPEDEQEAGETLPRGHANNDGDFTPTRAQQSVLGFKRKKTSAQLDTDDCRKIKRQEAKGENAGDEVLEKPGPDIGGPSLFDRVSSNVIPSQR